MMRVVAAILFSILVFATSSEARLSQSGQCSAAKKYRNGSSCVHACPSTRFVDGFECVTVCHASKFIDDKQCVEACPAGKVAEASTRECFDSEEGAASFGGAFDTVHDPLSG